MKKKISKTITLLLVCSLMVIFHSCKQDPTKGILKVYCINTNSYENVEGITVELYSSNSDYKLQTETTTDLGYVWFNDLASGSYWVKTNDHQLWTQSSGTAMVEADQVATIRLKVYVK